MSRHISPESTSYMIILLLNAQHAEQTLLLSFTLTLWAWTHVTSAISQPGKRGELKKGGLDWKCFQGASTFNCKVTNSLSQLTEKENSGKRSVISKPSAKISPCNVVMECYQVTGLLYQNFHIYLVLFIHHPLNFTLTFYFVELSAKQIGSITGALTYTLPVVNQCSGEGRLLSFFQN